MNRPGESFASAAPGVRGMQVAEQMHAVADESFRSAVPSPLGLGPDDAFRSSVNGWGIGGTL